LLASKLSIKYLKTVNPTLNFQAGNVGSIPLIEPSVEEKQQINILCEQALIIARNDWDSCEISWDFKRPPILLLDRDDINLSYEILRTKDNSDIQTLKGIEEKINQIFIRTYGLEKEEDKFVSEELITLRVNPLYRYGNNDDLEVLENRLRSDNFSELVSFSIGCMMGRYSLDRVGLVYAQTGSVGYRELEAQGAYHTFSADDDGIIPLASEDWLFDDDATTRFKEFVKTVWGNKHLDRNLEFIAESLCLHALKSKNCESAIDTFRRYFSTQFFKDHCKIYRKRPIYWLFSSGKEKAFECLVYLHRYNEGTLSRMRTEYVTPLLGKYDAQHTLLSEQLISATGTEQRALDKDIKSLTKKQAELRTFDEQLKHYAEMRITLDLDDGVKANYGKFGNLLADVKAIHGKPVK
jgi:type II restriction/modification system DNA methylase subunit YeeA